MQQRSRPRAKAKSAIYRPPHGNRIRNERENKSKRRQAAPTSKWASLAFEKPLVFVSATLAMINFWFERSDPLPAYRIRNSEQKRRSCWHHNVRASQLPRMP